MELVEWQQTGRYITYKGNSIFYQIGGEGSKTILLIHGFPTASWDWHLVWQTLIESGFRVIAPDMIGFGFSDKPIDYTYSIHDQADLHEHLLLELGVQEFHILAHDYGDSVAQELLARFNERTQAKNNVWQLHSVCFLNGGIFPEMHRARLIQKLLNSPVGVLISRLFSERNFRRSFSEVFGTYTKPSDKELKEFWKLIQYKNGNRISHKLIGYINDRRTHRERWVKALIEAIIPLRLINGPEDPVSGLHAAERYKELVPKADVVLLDKIGHYPQTEAPEKVLEAYLEFVK